MLVGEAPDTSRFADEGGEQAGSSPATEPVVEQPVEGGQAVVDEPAVDEPVVTEPVSEEPVVDEPVVEEPYIDPQQVEYLRTQNAQLYQQLAKMRKQVEDFELAGLSEEEKERELFRREKQEWQQQMQTFRQQQEINQWRQYWSQFADQSQLQQLSDPAEMGHVVVTNLYTELDNARKEIAALKRAVQPQAGPQVTTGGQSPTETKSLIEMTPAERERVMQQARMGHFPL